MEDEGFSQWINYSARERLANHIETTYLTPLKAELHILHERDKKIEKMCEDILIQPKINTGDYGPGGECPFCHEICSWHESMSDIIHEPDCAYIIAKDLSAGH